MPIAEDCNFRGVNFFDAEFRIVVKAVISTNASL